MMNVAGRVVLSLCALILLQGLAFGQEKVYHYYPAKVELSGTLIKKMFYGPPGYGEDPKHDRKEHVFILRLAKPIRVVADSPDYTSHESAREIQVNNSKRLKLEPMLKKKVRIRGTLSSAAIGHDHTDVLIDAEEVIPEGALGAATSATSGMSSSPEDVINRLYRDFSKKGSGSVHVQGREVLSRYFDGRLVDLLIKDQECQKREKGICNLDFMIQYGAQDDEITGLRVGVFDPAKQSSEVTFRNFGKPQTLIYRMNKSREGWRISDIRYEKGRSLVELLSND